MLYPWRCADCQQITDVRRSVEDIDQPPEQCESCGSASFSERMIARPSGCKGYILSDSGLGWSSHGYYNKPYWPEKK